MGKASKIISAILFIIFPQLWIPGLIILIYHLAKKLSKSLKKKSSKKDERDKVHDITYESGASIYF